MTNDLAAELPPMTIAAPPRVAVISGGSRDAGRAVSLELARQGLMVVLFHSPAGAASAQEALQLLAADCPGAIAMPVDVADESEVATAFDRVTDLFGGIDVVVNFAGHLVLAPIVDLDLSDFDAMHRTLVRGAFVLCRQAARCVRRGGSIVNLSSAVVGAAPATASAWVSAKAAVEGLSRVVAAELRERDINVNALSAGPTSAERAFLAPGEEPLADHAIADLVGYLVGTGGHWMTGQVLGGTTARP